jgi:hypothetical protein
MKNLSILTLSLLSLTFLPSQLVKSEPITNENTTYLKQYLSDIGPTKTIREGKFVNGEHKIKGMARLIQAENGRYYLEFDRKFATDKGPDLFVVLHRSEDVLGSSSAPNYSLEKADYYTVSPLLELKGKQRYILPGDFDPSEFNSVAIWCRQMNVTFGAASLTNVK